MAVLAKVVGFSKTSYYPNARHLDWLGGFVAEDHAGEYARCVAPAVYPDGAGERAAGRPSDLPSRVT